MVTFKSGDYCMKPHRRRATGKTTYFKLAYYDTKNMCWHDTPPQYGSKDALMRAAMVLGAGRYRISVCSDGKPRVDQEVFTIGDT